MVVRDVNSRMPLATGCNTAFDCRSLVNSTFLSITALETPLQWSAGFHYDECIVYEVEICAGIRDCLALQIHKTLLSMVFCLQWSLASKSSSEQSTGNLIAIT
jgi:hypothetical protein